jgi:CheY-like chemotaxis protein
MGHLNILAVDDDEINLEIIAQTVLQAGHEFKGVTDGQSGLHYLDANKDIIDIILLDKMMPEMSGMEVLQHIKANPATAHIPVILQTGDAGTTEVQEGLEAGAYYYLTKPFYPKVLLALIEAAARDLISKDTSRQEMRQDKSAVDMLLDGTFAAKTPLQMEVLAIKIACQAENPERIEAALLHLLNNAVEHGNLGIGYEYKTKLLHSGTWDDTVKKMLASLEHKDKKVIVTFHRKETEIVVTIKDEGQGFEWQKYMDYDPTRLTDPNGRGIATARIMGLDNLSYEGKGNKLRCSFKVKTAKED